MAIWCALAAGRRAWRLADGQRRGWAMLALSVIALAASAAWRLLSPIPRFDAAPALPGHLLALSGLALLLSAALALRPPRREAVDESTLLLDLIVTIATLAIAVWTLVFVPASDGRTGLSRRELLTFGHGSAGSALLLTVILLGLRLPAGRQTVVGPLLAGIGAVGLAELARSAAHLNGWTDSSTADAFPAAAMILLVITLGRERRRMRRGSATLSTRSDDATAGTWQSWLALPSATLLTVLVVRSLFAEQRHPSDPVVALGGLIVIGLALVRQGIGLSGQRRWTRYYSRRAEHDPLTDLINHRALGERLEQELAFANMTRQPLAVALIDVDRFKEVNDNLGHLAGDHVLKEIAAALERSCRDTDVAARYAGDEFALLLPGLELETAATVGNRVLNEVAKLGFYAGAEAEQAVGVSIGVAVTRGAGRNHPQMIAAADAALYEAKRAGRNCVSVLDADALDIHEETEIDGRRLIGAHPAV
jgi:diguanylate cyclase (GGDEF)-like protein